MIFRNEILQIGTTQKTYGVKGEIVILFRTPEYADLDTDCYFLEIEGIPVPFFVEDLVYTSDCSARVKLEGVDDEQRALRYVNLPVFLPQERVKPAMREEATDWFFFIGYKVIDQTGTEIGIITAVDDATMNVLFIVVRGTEELLIPATEDFITAVDEQERILEMVLPEGLLE